MAYTQKDANQALDDYLGRAGSIFGMTAEEVRAMGIQVHIVPASQLGGWASETKGTDIYISSNEANYQASIAYELGHAMAAGAPGGGDSLNPDGSFKFDSPAARLGEALSEYMLEKLGFPHSTNDSPQSKQIAPVVEALRNMDTTQVAALRAAFVSGDHHMVGAFLGAVNNGSVASFLSGNMPAGDHPINGPEHGGPRWGNTGPGGLHLTPPPTTLTGTGPSAATQAARIASWTNMLAQYGIKPDAATEAIMKQVAAMGGGTTSAFLNKFYGTAQFTNNFPGILNASGGLKMSLAQYESQKKDYQALAASAGVDLKPGEIPYLFRNNVSPTEFRMKVAAEGQLLRNPALFAAFNKQLQAMGMQPLNKADQYKFLMGMGNQEWTKVWNDANSRYGGNQAGITFNGKGIGGNPSREAEYTNLGKAAVGFIAGKGLSPAEMQAGYQKLAQQLTTTLPLSRIQKFGLTKQDLVELEFGGKRQAAVAQTVQSILKNESNIEDQSNKVMGIAGVQPGARTQGSQQSFAES